MDDTTNRIVDQQPIEKKRPNSDKTQLRTGVYSSGLIARLSDGRELIVYNTNIGHAGEWLDEILQQRPSNLDPPLIMSDALSSNHITNIKTIDSLCNAHGRRQYADVFHHFPQEVTWVLEQYQRIWEHDDDAHEQNMTPEQRCNYHRTHSLPVMESIRAWGEAQLKTSVVEANSGLGKAIRYVDKHYEGLVGFCHHVGAQMSATLLPATSRPVLKRASMPLTISMRSNAILTKQSAIPNPGCLGATSKRFRA